MALKPEDQKNIESLAVKLIDYYKFNRPPIPVDKILYQPPEGLESVDISDLSLVFGIGEHRYEYRMAMARLLYREICRMQADKNRDLPYQREAVQYFAAALLIPEDWVTRAARWPFKTLQKLSEEFQVPEYVMSTRLALLGKHVRGME